ncbi:unnamed protein product [Microthlaspi erraticum]|uniref:F-box domain-containing protein n=1 Tax=Microthlaspi erraticum TaxID=1685480 RepID=A0A6D2I8L8_9BRAS|nr:unnamed protein product [Microthlaspi erraticum]CAA7047944.1 unnamed protein product [Microthlaspi erraticum]
MEQKEAKKRKGNTRRRESTRSKSILSFPLDLTREILSRLPLKSVVRFRCVSKLWSSLTTNPYFISSFGDNSSTRQTLLLCFTKGDKLFVSSIPQHTQDSNNSSPLPIERYHMKLPGYGFHDLTESVHGFICVESSPNPLVWNPSMRSFLPLPNPTNHKSWNSKTLFLGYDPIEGKYKVVCIRYKKVSYVCRVLTLGSAQESWRTVRTKHKHRAGYYTYGRCINGVIYYIARDQCKPSGFGFVIMSFDVRYEKFKMIELPSNIDDPVLINYDGRLACSDSDNYNIRIRDNERRLWILEDAEKHKWSTQDYLLPFDPISRTDMKLRGVTTAGEFVYVPPSFLKSYYILFLDPMGNSYRRFEFKGMADGGGESWPDYIVRHGMYDLNHFHAFPNHTESLMSL